MRCHVGFYSLLRLLHEIKEELDADISIGELVDTFEYDYPVFHLIIHGFLCELTSEHVVLLEHEVAKWLAPDKLDSVDLLPVALGLINKLSRY